METSLVELGNRLASYRHAAKPADYGISPVGARRTPGLRREEVAELTGFSLDLISKVERGKYPSVSARLLSRLSDFYHLDSAKRSDLFNLARLDDRAEGIILERDVSPSLQQMLDHQREYPAFVMNRRWDIIAWNEALCLVMGDMPSMPEEIRNILWIMFGSPVAKNLIVDWESHARRVLGQFRLDYGWARGDARFETLVEELKQASPDFAAWWSGPLDIRAKQIIYKQINHPLVGLLDFQQMGFRLEDHPNLVFGVYYPSNAHTADLLHRFIQPSARPLVVTPAADFPPVAELIRSQGD